jgi:hypothetical protein
MLVAGTISFVMLLRNRRRAKAHGATKNAGPD